MSFETGSMEVRITSFSYSFVVKTGRASLNIHGTVTRPQVTCKFSLENSKTGQHRLTFREATIFDGSEPRQVAVYVKNALLDFVETHSDIPESFRPKLKNCILTHHLQTK